MKKYLSGLVILLIAVIAAAFTAPDKIKNQNNWFEYYGYLGADETNMSISNPYNWEYLGSSMPLDYCNGDGDICIIAYFDLVPFRTFILFQSAYSLMSGGLVQSRKEQ